jgi:hypothetical protein
MFDIIYKSQGDGSAAPMTCVQSSAASHGIPFISMSVSAMRGDDGSLIGSLVRVVNAPEGEGDDFNGVGYTLSDVQSEMLAAFDRAVDHLAAVSLTNPPRPARGEGENAVPRARQRNVNVSSNARPADAPRPGQVGGGLSLFSSKDRGGLRATISEVSKHFKNK